MGRGGGKGGGGRGGGGRGGSNATRTPAQVAIQDFGGRSNPDGSITLSKSLIEDTIGYTVRRRNTGSVASASIGVQSISANSVGSVEYSMRNVRLDGNALNVRRVSGQAYVGTTYREGMEKVAKLLGDNVSINWIG